MKPTALQINQSSVALRAILLAGLLSSCTMQAGIAVHAETAAAPEVMLQNPLFILRGVRDIEYGDLFCEHVSGIMVLEEGYGLTMCGALVNFY